MAVYGINYSAHRSLLVVDPVFNNGKDSTIKLTEEMKESNEKLGYSRADHWRAKELKARIVVPPKDNCKTM